ncbi:aldehyde dehydrogenase [Brevibacterium album]|uniref:aldehyde dehydrogenase n=1 Tax=Brevibacterium album TaxID=417948 RepID=UPI00068766C6|nr:aldehyde dehydrogenase [Brevibacterium album]
MADDQSPDMPADRGLPSHQMLIGGDWCDTETGARLTTVNPYTGEAWAMVPDGRPGDVDAAVAAASAALTGQWGSLTATRRGGLMRRLADLLRERGPELARIESRDNGKLLRETSGQLDSLPDWYDYFGGLADKLEGATPPATKPDLFTYTRHEPVGVVGAILPWNSPLLLMSFKVAPALAAGCTVVVKPSEQTPVSTLEFARLFEEAGFPPGVFNVVTGGREVGARIASHPDVAKVAFTGSTEAGVQVMRSAADHVARVTLELGGKSPNIVFGDADLEAATSGVLAGIFAATGQTCIAGSRLLVHRSVHEALLEKVVARARTIVLGDPAAPETEMGPCATAEQLAKVEGFVDRARADGLTVLSGGRRPEDAALARGYFYEPTIVTGASSDHEIAREEIFGPVLTVIPFDTEEEAVAIANDTRFGLGAGVWTSDVKRAHRVAHAIRAGSVWVNCYRMLTYNMPFGGYGMSGTGRENGLEAIREYTETKGVWINLSGESRDPFVMG